LGSRGLHSCAANRAGDTPDSMDPILSDIRHKTFPGFRQSRFATSVHQVPAAPLAWATSTRRQQMTQRPNPSLQPTCYGLRPPHAAELKR
jgi:hypothetical protein